MAVTCSSTSTSLLCMQIWVSSTQTSPTHQVQLLLSGMFFKDYNNSAVFPISFVPFPNNYTGLAEKTQLLKLNVPATFMLVALDEGPGPPIKYQYAELGKLYTVVSQLVRCCDVSSRMQSSINGESIFHLAALILRNSKLSRENPMRIYILAQDIETDKLATRSSCTVKAEL